MTVMMMMMMMMMMMEEEEEDNNVMAVLVTMSDAVTRTWITVVVPIAHRTATSRVSHEKGHEREDYSANQKDSFAISSTAVVLKPFSFLFSFCFILFTLHPNS